MSQPTLLRVFPPSRKNFLTHGVALKVADCRARWSGVRQTVRRREGRRGWVVKPVDSVPEGR